MIPLRIAFDMDGTLADLSSAYAEIEDRVLGPKLAAHEPPAPEVREVAQHVEEDAPAAATIGDNSPPVERRSSRGKLPASRSSVARDRGDAELLDDTASRSRPARSSGSIN